MRMNHIFLAAGLVLAATNGVGAAAETTNIPGPRIAVTNAPQNQAMAYYFHGAIRCETCLKIEKQARDFMERRFKELKAKQLVFQPVDYGQPENTHFLKDHSLPCPSLALHEDA